MREQRRWWDIGATKTLLNNIFVVTSWIGLLTIGFVLSSQEFFGRVHSSSLWIALGYMILGALTFTPSNVALLAMLSCFLGQEAGREDNQQVSYPNMWRKAVMQGAIVFSTVFFASGWIDKDIVLNATQADYFTLASSTIFLGLAVGYDPTKLKGLITRS